MRAKTLFLFAALASFPPIAFGQGNHSPAPPSDSYTDKDSGFVFPPTAGPFQRTNIFPVSDPKALWVDYRGFTPDVKVNIRIILRQRPAGRHGIVSCQEGINQERDSMQEKLKSFATFSAPKPPEFAGYTSAGLTENIGPPGHVGVTDFYAYCSRTTSWMVLYGFMHAQGTDATAQEIAFIRGVKPMGA
jgi:hypothetical protein